MAFFGNLFKGFTNQSQQLEKLGRITVGSDTVEVDCISNTGVIYINGLFMPYNMTIEQSILWIIHENISQLVLQQLHFQKGDNPPRLAHEWETRTFLFSHWKYYATNRIKVTATLSYPDDGPDTFFV